MKIDLSPFIESKDKSFKIEGELTKPFDKYDTSDLKLVYPIKYEGVIYDLNGEFLLDLNTCYEYEVECSRCLKDLLNKVSTNLNYVLFTEKPKEFEEDSVTEYIILEDNELDIEDVVFSQIITSIPIKVLCKEDCKGLCPQCGKDLNEGPCNCEREDLIDPRFQKLQGLFNEEV